MNIQVYYNANIFTNDEKQPTAQAFAVKDGRIVFVGSNEEAKKFGNGVDLQNKFVMPGFIDSHCHLVSASTSKNMNFLFVDESTTPENLENAIIEECKNNDIDINSERVLRVAGIDITKGNFLASCIGEKLKNVAVFVFSTDGHMLLMNEKALELAEITKDTPDPSEISYFSRDEQGNPTGLAIEISAMLMCKKAFDEKINDDTKAVLTEVERKWNSFGYTTVFDAMTSDETDNFKIYDMLDEAKHTLRIATSYCIRDAKNIKQGITKAKEIKKKYTSENLLPNTIKIIYDGTIEEHSAFLKQPYSDETDNFGGSLLEKEQCKIITDYATEAGFDVHIHAIGDKATEDIVDIFSRVGGKRIIAHNQLYSKEASEKLFKNKDIIFQTTPQWVENDQYTKQFIGDQRYNNQFPVGDAVKNGLCVTFGSDTANDEKMINPFIGIYFAVTRGKNDETYPTSEQAISVYDALLAYTKNGAFQLGLENETGMIKQGLSADFVILSDNIINCEKINEVTVEKTFFRGECVFDSEEDKEAKSEIVF